MPSEDGEVLGLLPDEFERWWGEHWQVGEHVCFVGPTGEGKTTAAVAMLKPRKYVLALDPKGGDETLEKLGYPRMADWPPGRRFWRDIEEGHPSRWIVGQTCERPQDYDALGRTLKRCMDDVFSAGRFTLYIDELEIASRFMKLRADIELFLIAARNRKVSVMTAFQRPSWVPTSASSQTTWFSTFYTRDIDVVGRLGEMAGRPRHEMRGLVKGLGELDHSLLLFSRRPRDPVVVTKPPKVD